MRNWHMADSHFGADSKDIIVRENRPFKDIFEYTDEQVRICNEQASSDDVIMYLLDQKINFNDKDPSLSCW